jgi:hypothetical protein
MRRDRPPTYEPMTHHDAVASMAPERYVLEEMSGEERERFEAHFFDCAECADDLRTADRLRQEIRASGGRMSPAQAVGGPPTVVPMRRSWRSAAVLPWAAAASLALVAGYQSFVTLPALRQRAGPQALTPVALRGATRGADVIVPIAPGQTFVMLAADIMVEADARQVRFELLGPDRVALTSGLASTPLSGAPLVLLVPADRFAAQGAHALIVRDASRPEDVLGEFTFVISR